MYPGSPQFEFLGSLTAKSQRRYLRGGVNVLPYIVWGRRTRDVGHMKRYCINDYSLVWSLINFVFPNTGLQRFCHMLHQCENSRYHLTWQRDLTALTSNWNVHSLLSCVALLWRPLTMSIHPSVFGSYCLILWLMPIHGDPCIKTIFNPSISASMPEPTKFLQWPKALPIGVDHVPRDSGSVPDCYGC